jgi:signal transduction histidine kinase
MEPARLAGESSLLGMRKICDSARFSAPDTDIGISIFCEPMQSRWYQSLYWRIAIGVVAFLAAMLVVQAVLFVWTVSQTGRTLPGQSPGRLGMAVAVDLANVLERDPQTDLTKYVNDQYRQYNHPFFVMMQDGRFVTSGSQWFPEPLIRMARARLAQPLAGGRVDRPGPWPGRGPGPRPPPDWWELPDRFADRLERDPSGYRFVRPSPIVVHNQLAGVVVVPARAPFGYLFRQFAPILAFVAAGVLMVGTLLTSVMIFGPARRRLRALEVAAQRLGSGDLAARAPDRGGDEIAAVARAFNAMADHLAARAEALTASDRARRQLFADVSHELNTPVTAMRGYLETLRMPEIALDESTRSRYLTVISDETARLERLIGELLELARWEAGGGKLRIEPVSVAQLFTRVLARHERVCATGGILMQTTIGSGAETVSGDRDRLEQAIQNLVANAMRFATRGSTVQLGARRHAASVALSVTDEGPGIAADHLPHIFDRFYKADSARAGASGGSGLGLSIVKAIVERHGGSITVRSKPGQTVFEITGLPP